MDKLKTLTLNNTILTYRLILTSQLIIPAELNVYNSEHLLVVT